MSAAHVITVVKQKALKLRYNELTMQLPTGCGLQQLVTA